MPPTKIATNELADYCLLNQVLYIADRYDAEEVKKSVTDLMRKLYDTFSPETKASLRHFGW